MTYVTLMCYNGIEMSDDFLSIRFLKALLIVPGNIVRSGSEYDIDRRKERDRIMRMKRFVLLLAAVILIGISFAAPVNAYDDEGVCGKNGSDIKWSIDLSSYLLTVSGNGEMADFEKGGAPWNKYSSFIEKVVIEDGITHIGSYAFYCCYLFKELKIPASVKTIGDHAFDACESVKTIELPSDLASIGEEAFSACISLKRIDIPDTVAAIGEGAFEYCSSLSEISFPKGISEFVKGVLRGCSELSEIVIPEGVVSIEDEAFAHCSSLHEIKLPKSVGTIGESAFEGCVSLEKITLCEGLKKNR